MNKYYMGIDVGSVSTNIVLMDEQKSPLQKVFANPRKTYRDIKKGIRQIVEEIGEVEILGVGATGSGRYLANIIVGADIVKNEITAHAVAGLNSNPKVRTIIEIGGQDSKIIILRDGIVVDFAMNTVCAAGTGSFLDRQAARLGIDISDFGSLALKSKSPVRIAGRCAVFAESDMIHKQQLGHNQYDIAKGLCDALVRNYLSNVGKGKEILEPVLFQGGVAANIGIKKAFEEALNMEIIVPQNFDVMGAIGAAILAQEEMKNKKKSNFRGFEIHNMDYNVKGFECNGCSNRCEVVEIKDEIKVLARYGDKCGKWSNFIEKDKSKLA